jgi:DNA repair protein RecN (Recombination protein N)
VNSQDELVSIYKEFKSQLNDTEELELIIEKAEKSIEIFLVELNKLDQVIQDVRLAQKTRIELEIQHLLNELKMPNTKFVFELEDLAQLTEFGSKKISILFSPNVGLELKPIEKVASGGELSRLMLCIQLLLSEKKSLPSIIFDEIDTGVSGDVAQKMGELLKRMGNKMQVLSITHLPQVAAKGDHQFKVSKQVVNNETITSVYKLTQNERIQEIARLMSGENITESAIQNANELIKG